MRIQYRDRDDYRPVDIDKLRPQGSYGELIASRTHSIDDLVERFGEIPKELLKHRNCPHCQSDAKLSELSKDSLTLVRCGVCDLVYVDPIFDEEHYDNTYRSREYQDIVKSLGEKSHEYRVARFGSERIEIIGRHLTGCETPRFLDIGCSTGFVVEAAAEAGWDAQGIDLNPSAVEFGKQRGLSLHNVALHDFYAEPGSFDAIGLFDVLEHIPNPKQILAKAFDLLSDDGIIFIYVPNYDSASRFLMGADAHFIWPTHHLTYFTPKTITEFVQSLGLTVEEVMTEGLDLVDYLWKQEDVHGRDMQALRDILDDLQFFINSSLYGKNLRIVCRK